MQRKISPKMIEILKHLEDKKFHDGDSLGKSLGMSRTAIWKLLKKLEKYGISLTSIKGKGYSLSEPLILLQSDQITPHLITPAELTIFDHIDSTNEYLKKQKNNKIPLFCLAECQTKGKGRLNRPWHSPFGKNIYFSCRYPFKKDVSELGGLSLVVGLLVIKVLQQWGLDRKLHVKWPNDVYYDHKKLAGILVELQVESHDCISQAIIGIGINVNMSEDATAQLPNATSVATVLKKPIDRNLLCADLINALMSQLLLFEQKGLHPFLDEWMAVDCLMHKTIIIKNATEKWQGTVQGVNLQGQLLLQLPEGAIRAFSSGEVTIANIN